MKENEAIQILNGNVDISENAIVRATAVLSLQEIQKYRVLGTVEELQEGMEKQKEIEDIVNMQLIAGKDNYKEIFNSFCKIVKVVQR